jgi:hypothetical protein
MTNLVHYFILHSVRIYSYANSLLSVLTRNTVRGEFMRLDFMSARNLQPQLTRRDVVLPVFKLILFRFVVFGTEYAPLIFLFFQVG